MYRVNILREQGNAFVLSRSHVPSQRLHRGRSRRPVGDHTPLRAAEESMQPVVEQPGVDPKVAEALQKVQEAMNVAEGALDDVPNLPSARLPTVWDKVFKFFKPIIQISALLLYVAAIHSLTAPITFIGSLFTGLAVATWGYRKGSLSTSGAIAATLVGWSTCAMSFRNTFVVLSFFFSSSKLTQLGDEDKAVDEDHKSGGQRDWRQVACNSLIPTILTIASGYLTGGEDMPLQPAADRTVAALSGAFLGYYACCCGDTWASELGQLSLEEPRLITTLRPVRKGTNGGVTLTGLAASLGGGLFMGFIFYAMSIISPTGNYSFAVQQWKIIPFGLVAGLVGSIIDSILGATIQFTGYNRDNGKITSKVGDNVTPISGLPLLDNNAVNLVSASMTAALSGFATVFLF